MEVQLVAFGIAKDILKGNRKSVELRDGSDIGALKSQLIREYPAFKDLAKLSFATGTEYRQDNYKLQADEEVVIIPPVSGG